MPSALPDGDPAPSDGSVPDAALADLDSHTFSAYVHVPFCVTRCGYCDFNTYTAQELGGMSQGTYVDAVLREVDLARRVLGGSPPLSTIFFGGGRRLCWRPQIRPASLGGCGKSLISLPTAR